MYATSENDSLEFDVSFKVSRKVKKGFLGFGATYEDYGILNDVKAKIGSGTMTALLGASGCGKSTLLAALSQRLRGDLSGRIHFNGEVMDRTKMTKVSGFVPQNDVFVGGLTVREHFYFMVELKLPRLSQHEKRHLIDSSIVKFGLDGRTHLKHLSGGEKRKLSLASELLTKPRILFCDEPTSGLDSFSAFAVMNTLRDLAGYTNKLKSSRKHQLPPSRIILFSIHQPTSDIFHLFTNIILMNSGRIIFHGTVQEAQTLFTSIGMKCPPLYNPAEFYVNKISDPKVTNEIVKHVSKTDCDRETSPYQSSESKSDDESKCEAKVSWIRQVFLLSYRATLSFMHNPKSYLIELFILLIFSLILTAVYSGISFESDTSVQDIRGFLVILATEILFTFVYSVFYLFYEVLPLLRKETGDRLYSLSAYYVSFVLIMIPRVFFETFMYTALIYFSTDIGRSFETYLQISTAISLSGICAMAYGFFLSGLFENFFIGTELSAITDLILMLVSGMYMSVKTVPFLKYISFFFYANETVSMIFWLKVDEIKCSVNPETLCFRNGTSVLESFSFGTTEFDIYKDYFYQLILTVILHILGFIGIRRNVRKAGFY